jgi:hypothetical protein
MTIVDTSKRVWRVDYRDEQGRRCTSFVNAETEVGAACAAGVTKPENVFEINPVTGQRIYRGGIW